MHAKKVERLLDEQPPRRVPMGRLPAQRAQDVGARWIRLGEARAELDRSAAIERQGEGLQAGILSIT